MTESTIFKLTKVNKPSNENNPISSNVFFADPTAVEFEGRMYVYGTNDSQQYEINGGEKENGYGGINSLVCYSTADMVNWTYHGVLEVSKIATWAHCSWAPSMVKKEVNGKEKFYLYFCNSGNGVGVLTADHPAGPWKDELGHALVNNQLLGDDPVCWCFDPGVCVDDNGVGWLAFGGGAPMHPEAHGETSMYTGNCRLVKLGDDMISLASDIIKVPAVHHFEANELNFINGRYLLTYCSNYGERDQWTDDLGKPSQTCSMCYMVCEGDPLNVGDWKYGGEYLTNPNQHGYPFSNNHSHMQKFGDKYYILYQNVSLLENKGENVNGGYRSIGVDDIEVDEENGIIKSAKMTDSGVEKIRYVNAFETNSALTHHSAAGIYYKKKADGKYVVCDIDEGDYILIKNVCFGEGANQFSVLANGNGVVEIRLDSPDAMAKGRVEFETDGYEACKCELEEKINGTHDLYLVFGRSFEFDSWQFS